MDSPNALEIVVFPLFHIKSPLFRFGEIRQEGTCSSNLRAMFLDQTRWPPTTPIFSPYSETFAQVRQQYRDFYHRDKTGERDIVDLDEQFPIRFVFVFDTELGKELLTWMTSFLSHLSLYLYLSYTLSTWRTSFLSTFNAFPLLVCLRNCFANYLLHSNESIITRIFSFSKFDSPNFSATSWKMLLLGCLSCIVLRRRKKLRIKTQSERRWWLWRWRWWRTNLNIRTLMTQVPDLSWSHWMDERRGRCVEVKNHPLMNIFPDILLFRQFGAM